MSTRKHPPFKTVAWNGISLKIPTSWELDSLDETHMLLGEDQQPKIELKWTDAPRKFTLKKYLKNFVSKSQKILDIQIHELPVPDSFSHPDQAYEFFFFSWNSIASSGNGALIFCDHCKRLTMIRFFSETRFAHDSLPYLILTSLVDHTETDQAHWEVFGMRFFIPKRFVLKEYSFKPGSYLITFQHHKIIITIFSWGPAKFLLADIDLSQFAKQRLRHLKGLARTGVCSHGSYFEWSFRPERFKNAHILPLLKNYAWFNVFRLCHDNQNNRILGIMVESKHKYERELIYGSFIGDG